MSTFISQTKVSYDFPSEIINERKFDTAIRSTFDYRFKERMSQGCLSFLDVAMKEQLKNNWYPDEWSRDTTLLPRLFSHLLTPGVRLASSSTNRVKLQMIMNCMSKVYRVQMDYLLSQFTIPNKPIVVSKMNSYLNSIEIPPEISNLMYLAEWFSKAIDDMSRLKRRKGKTPDDQHVTWLKNCNKYVEDKCQLVFVIGDNIVYGKFKSSEWLLPGPIMLMLHNKVCDMISVLMFAHLSQGTSLCINAYSKTLEFVKELCTLAIKFKGKYFDIAKTLESLCVAETLIKHEEWTNDEFLTTTSSDLYESTSFDYMGSNLRTIFLEVDTPFRHELCCLSKLMGHPYVNMKGGAYSMHKKTTEVYTINLLKVQECTNYIKQNYVRNHIIKHKKWPPCTLEFGCTKAMTQAYVRGIDPNDPRLAKYGTTTLSDYNYVNLEPNMRFHKLENIIPYLKDKTISVLRSKVMKLYFDNQNEDVKTSWIETRMLLTYLLCPKIAHDHEKYIENYMDSDDLEELTDYLTIRIVPKEKELKTDFRGFGCKTYEDRARSVVQEQNCMRFLDEYSDEQAMTLGELELLRRLSSFRNLWKAYEGHKIIFLVVDASSWNNHFRSETVDDPLTVTLDKIFKTKMFGKTHLAYRKTLMYVNDKPISYLWRGQAGGVEGINQDSWVVIYIGQIKAALAALGVKYHILCKGDDLRVAVAIPPHIWQTRSLQDIKNDLVGRLATTMSEFGHQIKVLESYGSSKYFAFSKSASIDDVELPQGFRKIQKCYGSTNAMISTLDEYIASSMSNAHSACKVEPIVTPSYLVGLFWSFNYLLSHSQYKKCTIDELSSLMLIPSLAGGFPIIYLHNMHVRAESDLLSPFIGLYNFCRKYHSGISECMERFMVSKDLNDNQPYMMLYKDPYAIPHDRPPLPTAVLRSYIPRVLTRYVKNEDMKELLKVVKEKNDCNINEILESVNILNTKVLSALYSATPEGLLDEILRKFESARSINELLIKTLGFRQSVRILLRVVKAEKRLQIWRSNRLKGIKQPSYLVPYSHLFTQCPSESADKVRTFLWRKKVSGITMPPMQHQIYLTGAFASVADDWINKNHFEYHVYDPNKNVGVEGSLHYSSSDKKPFLGFTTRSGMTEPSVHFIEKDPMLQKVKNLVDLVSWTNVSSTNEKGEIYASNCNQVIQMILKSFTDIPLVKLAPFSGIRKSGTIQHHIRAPSFRESIVPNVLSNLYTRVVGESNSHVRFRTSKEHYFMNFLHVLCYSVWMGALELEFSYNTTTPNIYWAVTTDCEFCNRPINEEPIVFKLPPEGSIQLHPLAVSRIGSIAEEILRQSLRDSKINDIRTDIIKEEELPFNVAVIGLLQEIHDSTYTARKNLQIRYDHPGLGHEGYQVLSNLVPQSFHRDIGQSEIKRMRIEDLTSFVLLIVSYYNCEFCKRSIRDPTSTTLEFMRGEDLPWFGIIDYIYRSGLLPRMIINIASKVGSPHPTCYYNPVTASKYILRYAEIHSRSTTNVFPLVILSYYSSEYTMHKLRLMMCSLFKDIVYSDLLKIIPNKTVTNYLKEREYNTYLLVIAECYIIISAIEKIDSFCEVQQERIEESGACEVVGCGINDVTLMETLDLLDENVELSPLSIMLYNRLTKQGFDVTDLEDISEDVFADKVYSMSNRYDHCSRPVYFTNVGQCINKVRSGFVEEGDSSDSDHIGEFQLSVPPNPANLNRPKLKKPHVLVEYDAFVPSYSILEEGWINPVPRWLLPVYDCYAQLGSCTGSETHLIYFLQESDMVTKTIRTATCLADGYGGFTSAIHVLYPGSCVIYHSLPQDNQSMVRPVTSNIRQADAITLSDHLDEGYHDLSSWGFYERIMRYNIRSEIVTSDIELQPSQMEKMKSISQNMVKYYLINRSGDCIFFCKYPTSDTLSIIKVLDVLSNFCAYSGLYSPRSNNCSKYVYVYGIGWGKTYDERELVNIMSALPGVRTIPAVQKFFKQINRQIAVYNAELMGGLDLWRLTVDLKLSIIDHVGTIEDRFPSLILNDLDIPTIRSSEEEVPTTSMGVWDDVLSCIKETGNMTESLKVLGWSPKKMIHETEYLLRIQTDIRAVAREHMINKLFYLKGFQSVINRFSDVNTPWILSYGYVVEQFFEAYGKLQSRDKRDPEGGVSYLRMPWIWKDREIHYLPEYKKGVKTGIVWAGLFISSKTEKSNNR